MVKISLDSRRFAIIVACGTVLAILCTVLGAPVWSAAIMGTLLGAWMGCKCKFDSPSSD